MTDPIYILLDTDDIRNNQGTVLSIYFTDRQKALQHAHSEVQAILDTNTYQHHTIEPVETHWEGDNGQDKSDIIGYSVCDKDGKPLESITIQHVLPYLP